MRSALVTGSSRGLGRAIALRLAADGFRIAVHYVNSEQPAQEVADEIRAAGGTAEVFRADVADAAACTEVVKEVTKSFGSLEVLVNSAGITRDTLALRMKEADWDAVLDTNLSSAFHLSKAVLRGMVRAEAGRIIRSEEHTSELQSRGHLVCRLLLEDK